MTVIHDGKRWQVMSTNRQFCILQRTDHTGERVRKYGVPVAATQLVTPEQAKHIEDCHLGDNWKDCPACCELKQEAD